MTKNCHAKHHILENELHLWHINLLDFLNLDPNDLILNEIERKRKNRYIFEKHQLRFAACRKLLKIILANYLKLTATEIKILTTSDGKPYLVDDSINFNLSHSGDYMFLGICPNNALGVDIEYAKPRDFLGLAKHSFSNMEYLMVESASAQDIEKVFYKLWCQKEAFIKLDGRGLQYPLKDFSVNADDVGGLLELNSGNKDDYLLKTYQPAPKLFASYCVKNINIKTTFFKNQNIDLILKDLTDG